MKCPFCGEIETKVIDSRSNKDQSSIRRRRECLSCEKRFTTYEHVENLQVMIVKKDGRREAFNKEKIRSGLIKACEKRPVSMDAIDSIVSEIESDITEFPKKEFSSTYIGEKLMKKLRVLDEVAYVRFASVYREFKDASDFIDELKKFPKEKRRK
ncbi:MAG: transcriptional repressor NrdR [Desulfobacterales bacterium]|nr:transcriptional repressor NrdR [Desulfobacterales bacterium]